jgi:ribosomal protein S18 acetylase RimI-like enzyme
MEGLRTAQLTFEDTAAIQELIFKCADYVLLVDGHPPSPDGAREILEDLPPGKTREDKIALGAWAEDGRLICVLDAVRGYPGASDWWIGLLLIDPAYRGQGLGEKVCRLFEDWASENGAENVYLGVVEANDRAYKFWQRLGFEEVQRRPPAKFDRREHVVIVMKKTLSARMC